MKRTALALLVLFLVPACATEAPPAASEHTADFVAPTTAPDAFAASVRANGLEQYGTVEQLRDIAVSVCALDEQGSGPVALENLTAEMGPDGAALYFVALDTVCNR